jgi:protein-disulfide isomerase
MPPKPRKSTHDKRKPTTGSGPSRSLLIALGFAAVVVAALVVGTIVLTGGNDGNGTTSTGTNASLIAGIPQTGTVLGSPDAKVTFLQYEDLQCPVCKTYTDDAFPTIVEEYVKPGKVKIDFRGLSFIGDDSVKALRVALAAAKQDKLWDVVEAFYANQGRENSGWVTDAKVNGILAQVPGLDAAKVLADAKSAAITAEIGKLDKEGSDRQVQGTPSFFIGIGLDRPYAIQPTSLTPDAFRPALDDALQGP